MSTIHNISPAASAEEITPDDGTTIEPTRGIYVGVAGDLKVVMLDGTSVTFASLSAGIVHPISCVLVYATGTTATDIVAVR
jgi:hypothetical protein